MGEHYRIIRLDQKFAKRKPNGTEDERQIFNMAIMGIEGLNELARPFLRGFDVLNSLKPISPEIGSNAAVDTQRLHLIHKLADGKTALSVAIAYVLAFGEETVRDQPMEKETKTELESAIRYVHFLGRSFKKPDTDFELPSDSDVTPEDLSLEWTKNMVEPVIKIQIAGNGCMFGYRGEIKMPRRGVEIFSLDIGRIGNTLNNNGILRVDWAACSGFDLRWGKNGIYPTDGLRAISIQGSDLIFGIDENQIEFPQVQDSDGRVGDGIKLPHSHNVIYNPARYLETAARGTMQTIWHNLILEMPMSIPLLNLQQLQKEWGKYPRQRLAFIDKIVDAFMVDPRKAFQLCTQLGVWQASELFSGVNEATLAKIIEKLPTKNEHFERLVLDPKEYSVFKILISAINEVMPDAKVDSTKDLLVFYEKIFPSTKN